MIVCLSGDKLIMRFYALNDLCGKIEIGMFWLGFCRRPVIDVVEKIGVGVTAEAKSLFDALSKTYVSLLFLLTLLDSVAENLVFVITI